MITRIKAISKDEMRALRPMIRDAERVVAISVTDPDAAKVFDTETPRILPVVFNDITPMAWYGRLAVTDGMKFCSTWDAQRIVRFIINWANVDDHIEMWINCSAGINRSGSIARFALRHSEVSDTDFIAENPQIKGNDWVLMKLLEAEQELKI